MHFRSMFSAALLLLPAAAPAATFFTANLDPTNSSGVSGVINFTLDGAMLNVDLQARGLADGTHFLHIHGLDPGPVPGGRPVDTTPPPAPVPPNGDIDGNGALTTGEAKAAIGGVILSLAPHTPGLSGELDGVSSLGGLLSFTASYNLAQNIFEPGYGLADLLPLDYRVFDIHGGIVPLGVVQNGTTTAPGTFDINLPVAAGAITLVSSTVPEPASWALMVGGFGLVGGAIRRSRATNVRVSAA